METPSKGYFRLFPRQQSATVRLRYGYVVECTGCDKDADGNITAVHCNYLPDTKSGTPGADSVKVKGNIHWVSRRARLRGRGAPVRPPVCGAASRAAASAIS